MRNLLKFTVGAAALGLVLAGAHSALAQKPTEPPAGGAKPTTAQKPTEAAKPTTAEKPAEGANKPAEGAAKPAEGAAKPADGAAKGGKSEAAPGLKVGDWSCAGGASFKVTGPGTYANPDGGNAGTFTVNGNAITFSGGVLNGQPGRDLKDNKFTIGTSTSCGLK